MYIESPVYMYIQMYVLYLMIWNLSKRKRIKTYHSRYKRMFCKKKGIRECLKKQSSFYNPTFLDSWFLIQDNIKCRVYTMLLLLAKRWWNVQEEYIQKENNLGIYFSYIYIWKPIWDRFEYVLQITIEKYIFHTLWFYIQGSTTIPASHIKSMGWRLNIPRAFRYSCLYCRYITSGQATRLDQCQKK